MAKTITLLAAFLFFSCESMFAQWQQIKNDALEGTTDASYRIVHFKNNIHLLNHNTNLISKNKGETWQRLASSPSLFYQVPFALSNNEYIFSLRNLQLCRSSDGVVWEQLDMPYQVTSIKISKGKIFAFCSESYTPPNFHILVSDNNGDSWTKGFSLNEFGIMAETTSDKLVILTNDTVYISSNGIVAEKHQLNSSSFFKIVGDDKHLFSTNDDSTLFRLDLANETKKWTEIKKVEGYKIDRNNDISYVDSCLFARFDNDKEYQIFKSNDAGVSWNLLFSGDYPALIRSNFNFTFYNLKSIDNRLFGLSSGGVHISDDKGKTWTKKIDNLYYYTGIDTHNEKLFAINRNFQWIKGENTDTWFPSTLPDVAFSHINTRLEDSSIVFTAFKSRVDYQYSYLLRPNSNELVEISKDYKYFSDGRYSGIAFPNYEYTITKEYLFRYMVRDHVVKVERTRLAEINWQEINLPFSSTIFSDKQNLYSYPANSTIYISRDYGARWEAISLGNTDIGEVISRYLYDGSRMIFFYRSSSDYRIKMAAVSSTGKVDTHETNGLPDVRDDYTHFLKRIDNDYYILKNRSIYKSSIGSQHWSLLDTTGIGAHNQIFNIVRHKDKYIVSTNFGAFYSPRVITHTQEEVATHNVIFSPNPSKDFIRVNGTDTEGKIEILNSTGKSVLSQLTNGNEERLNIQGFPPGVYFLKLTQADKVYTKKVIIE